MYLLSQNDILFQSVRPYQRNNYLLNEDDDFLQYVASTGYIQLRTTLNPYFLFQLLNTDKINNEVMLRCTGTSYPAINSNDFSNILITITNDRNEQNKIAKFFSLIEERIQTQIKIINDYKILKNHIIKSFIKQNGTSYLLLEIAELGRGRVINSAEISKQKNPIYPVYSSQTSNNGIMGYLDNYDYEGEYITWTTDGANAGTVYYRNGKFNCTNVCGILKIKNGYDAYYISNILNCYTKKYVSTNLANPKLMNNVMANIKINLPSIEQQKHSSKILQSIEYRVEIEEDIKLNLVKQKAFLLKNMFI
jgi:type I restriction enzyme S subunit